MKITWPEVVVLIFLMSLPTFLFANKIDSDEFWERGIGIALIGLFGGVLAFLKSR